MDAENGGILQRVPMISALASKRLDVVHPLIDAMAKPGVPWVDVVKEKFGEDVLKSLKKRWEEADLSESSG